MKIMSKDNCFAMLQSSSLCNSTNVCMPTYILNKYVIIILFKLRTCTIFKFQTKK